ncbi:YceI family protein [Flavobacterium sp. W1B]|uniref:YceI family protein n=1 Tax=Flavobacterium sp. W1B TaxID=3394146 RepID=UPI0039BD1731
MKKILLLSLLLVANAIYAQEKMTAKNSSIVFEASVPFFEAVEAKNEKVNSILNTKKSTILFVAFITQFHFERSLMEEHFNNNYMDSKKYPKAIFKGVIEKFDMKNINEKKGEYLIRGEIVIRGKSKKINVIAQIKKIDEGMELISSFSLNTDDFNIEVPSIVRSKISKNVNVSVKTVF